MNQKNPTHRFAFVQYLYPQSLHTAIRDENGREVNGSTITVYPAKHDTATIPNLQIQKMPTFQHAPPQNPNSKTYPQHKPPARDHRSYKDVTKPPTTSQNNQKTPHPTDILNHTPQTYHFEEYIKPANLTEANPTQGRIISSRYLGEDTENIRKSLMEVEVEDDFAAAIKGNPCEDNTEMLERSVVAIAHSSQSSETIMEHILSEGVNCLSIKKMGGMQHLLTFNSAEDKQAMVDSKWLERWFITIKDADNRSATLWREVWINVYGVPLFAWGYENFRNIGSIFGRVISVNYKDFECANIMIYTDCLFDINCKISMEIEDVKHSIFISEKKQFQCQSPSPIIGNNEGMEKKYSVQSIFIIPRYVQS